MMLQVYNFTCHILVIHGVHSKYLNVGKGQDMEMMDKEGE